MHLVKVAVAEGEGYHCRFRAYERLALSGGFRVAPRDPDNDWRVWNGEKFIGAAMILTAGAVEALADRKVSAELRSSANNNHR